MHFGWHQHTSHLHGVQGVYQSTVIAEMNVLFPCFGAFRRADAIDMENATTLGTNVEIFIQLGVIAKARILLNLHEECRP